MSSIPPEPDDDSIDWPEPADDPETEPSHEPVPEIPDAS